MAVLLAGLCPTAQACSVPVFRYALLWWGARFRADCYQVVVFHRGPLDAARQALLDKLKSQAWQQGEGVNVAVAEVDLAGQVPEPAKKIWQAQHEATEPWVVLRYPPMLGIDRDVWAGPFDAGTTKQLIDSPVRHEIGKRLLAGQTAVWLLLESGNHDRDEAAAALLQSQLAQLQKQLQLPDEADDTLDTPGDRELETAAADQALPEIRIEFSIIRVKRSQPEERILRRMLQRSEADLEKDYADEPMVFPVFGRGRVLWGLVGGGINDQLIAEYCAYLVGMCSCQVKAQNPGFDLLMATPWNSLFESVAPSDPVVLDQLPGAIEAPVVSTAGPPDPAAASMTATPVQETTTTTPTKPAATEPVAVATSSDRLTGGIIAAVAVAVIVLVGLVLWIQRRYAKQ